jgi:hypothetical protein
MKLFYYQSILAVWETVPYLLWEFWAPNQLRVNGNTMFYLCLHKFNGVQFAVIRRQSKKSFPLAISSILCYVILFGHYSRYPLNLSSARI